MADEHSPESLKQMLAGFNAMQMQLGLLPNMTGGQQPLGIPLGAPPPPPMVPHPSEFAQAAYQQQQTMIQQTLQAAQATRYQPPPSAPTPSTGGGGGFSSTWGPMLGAAQAGQANPYMAQAMGGMPGMPNPGMMTSPQYGLYRGHPAPAPYMPPPNYAANVPPYMQPFAPQLPGAHFMSPYQQSYSVMQARQAQSVGMLGSLFGGGASIGGGMIGAGIGTMLGGPIGGFLGGLAGGAIGGGVGDLMTKPVMDDIRRGRSLQNIMSPWMVSGANLNPFTGQGMERGAAQDTARMLRQMTRTPEFEKMGFNTQDVMRITQLSADQGLLQTAQNPEQIAQQVKAISKSVKALVQITGDPDVRNAIASLGQMRTMGFEGLSAQTGAVANRAIFARMAGVSQAQMQQYEAAGAMQATQMGLSGATGIRAAQFGAGMANVAAGSGAVEGLALARAGGQQGLAQTLGRAQMAAAAFDPYLMAAVEKGPGGMRLNMDAYRANQGRSLSEVMQQAGEHMNALGPRGMLEFRRRRAELGERALQGMSPTEQMLMPLRQARAIQQDVGDLDLGSAFEVLAQRTGMSAGELQAMQQTYTDPRMYRGMQQQLRVQQRLAADQERARREQYRTPGLMRSAGQGIRGALNATSDFITSPFASFAERAQRVEEDRAAEQRGEHIERFQQSELIQTGADRQLALQGMRGGDYRRLTRATGDRMQEGFFGRMASEVGYRLDLSARDPAQRMVRAASESGGRGRLFGFFNDPYASVDSAQQRMADVGGAAAMIRAGETRSGAGAATQMGEVTRQARGQGAANFNMNSVLVDAAQVLRSKLHTAKGLSGAGALGASDIKETVVSSLTKSGMSREGAERMYEQRKEFWGGELTRQIMESGDKESIEPLMQTLRSADDAFGIDRRKERENIDAQMETNFKELGLKGGWFRHNIGSKDMEAVKRLIKTTDPKVLALAAAKIANNTDEEKRILSRMSPEQAIAARDQAGALIKAQGSDMRKMLETIGSSAQGNIEQRLREAKHTIGVKMGVDAFTSAASQIAKDVGVSDLSGADDEQSLLGRLAGMDPADIKKIKNAKLRNAALAFQSARGKGDQKGMDAAVASFQEGSVAEGPGATTNIVGGTSGAGTEAIDKDIESLRSARDEMMDTPEGKAQAVLADSAVVLGDAAKDLKSTTENLNNIMNSLAIQSLLGR